jgi:hypothetical protein
MRILAWAAFKRLHNVIPADHSCFSPSGFFMKASEQLLSPANAKRKVEHLARQAMF